MNFNPIVVAKQLSKNPVQREYINKILTAIWEYDDLADIANLIASLEKAKQFMIDRYKDWAKNACNEDLEKWVADAMKDWENSNDPIS